MIENCSHKNSSSGAGIHASFYGRNGRHPLIYCCSRRSHLKHRLDQGWSPVNLGKSEQEVLGNLLKIKTFIFDPAKSGYPQPPPHNITILYSGIFSKTEQALSTRNIRKHSIRSYTSDSEKRVKYIYDKFNNVFQDKSFQHSVTIHNSEILEQIFFNNNIKPQDKNVQLDSAYLELLVEALGNVCIILLNSVLSDWAFVHELMTSCQYILSSMGYSHPFIDSFVASLQSNAWEFETGNTHANYNEITPKISAKFTGAGKGGDIIVFSLYEPEQHQKLLKQSRLKHNIIHFDSSTMFDEQENASVQGVKREN